MYLWTPDVSGVYDYHYVSPDDFDLRPTPGPFTDVPYADLLPLFTILISKISKKDTFNTQYFGFSIRG